VAVASAGPYTSLHLAPDRQPRQHHTTQFFTDRMPFLPPNQQCQSTEGMHFRQNSRGVNFLKLCLHGCSSADVKPRPSRCPPSSPTALQLQCHVRKLLVPRTHNELGDKSFSAAGPRLWNDLPPGLRRPGLTFDSFRQSLKTHSSGDRSAQ